MKVLDLFSGIGGFSLGLERAGMETIAFCEFEPHAQKILRKHWPEVPIYDDVRTLDGTQFRGAVDVVCGGYPCQPFSVAGKQRGKQDERHLWPEMLRIIRECRPSWVVAENVIGHIKLGLDDVLSDLEAEGYAGGAIAIPACATGKNHQRQRVWILAYSSGNGCNGSEIDGRYAEPNERAAKGKEKIKHIKGCSRLRIGMDWEGRASEYWRAEPRICRMDDGIPDRMERLKRLGNAVVPQIPELIGRAILKSEESNEQQ